MKHFRVFNGAVQHVVAERCEVTQTKVVFSLSKIMVKSYDVSEVTRIEELDGGLNSTKVIFQVGFKH